MVAVQVLLMNYFLLGLHNGKHLSNDVLLPETVLETGCPYGCSQCTPINGCLACKPPYFLLLHREGARQTASCARVCPVGFYKFKRNKKRGFCAKCMLRGCSECSTRHYCSVCKTGLVRHAGRCRKRCPPGTLLGPRSQGLCLSTPTPAPDLAENEIVVGNTTWPRVATPTPPSPNATTTLKPPRKKRKRKREKEKNKKKERHRRRKHKEARLRNRRRKDRRRRRFRRIKERTKPTNTSTLAPGR
ncbi:R-spondin-1 [Procambarus clarkii]|uniref:R-spondin-1 n=1 Tax=Procambarus clarkii TaxID=6728 RepID=UPI001E6723D6|nr:R-spondin-1-like [Procambarus clarkii]